MDYKSAPFWCAGRLELEAVPKSSKWLAEVVNIFFFFDHKFGNIFFWNPKKKWMGQTGLRQRCRCRQWPLGDAYRTTSIFTFGSASLLSSVICISILIHLWMLSAWNFLSEYFLFERWKPVWFDLAVGNQFEWATQSWMFAAVYWLRPFCLFPLGKCWLLCCSLVLWMWMN